METIDRVRSEQTRARYPDSEGYVERDGVRTHYEVFGSGEPTVLLLPTWSIVHACAWKMDLACPGRRRRLVTPDGRGPGWWRRRAAGEAERQAASSAVQRAARGARVRRVGA